MAIIFNKLIVTFWCTLLLSGAENHTFIVLPQLINCLNNIAFKHFMSKGTIVLSYHRHSDNVPTFNTKMSSMHGIVDLVLKDFNVFQQWLFKVVSNIQSLKFGTSFTKPDCYILISDVENERLNMLEMRCQMATLKTSDNWNPRAKFVIIMCDNSKQTIINIFAELWKYRIINSILVVGNCEAKNVKVIESSEKQEIKLFEMYAWFPYSPPGRCANSYEPILLDYWMINKGNNGDFLHNRNLFPNKIPDDLEGCPIVASTFDYPPFFTNLKLTDTDGYVSYSDGFMLPLLQVLMKKLNISLRFLQPPSDGKMWGGPLDNGSWTGATGEVLRGDSDLVTTSFYNICHVLYGIEFTLTYFVDHMIWFLPCPTPWPRWMSISRVFNISMWLGTFVSYLIMSIFMHIVEVLCNKIKKHHERMDKKNVGSWLLHFAEVHMLGLSSIYPQNLTPTRIIFISWIIYCMSINYVYQTFLTSFFTNPGMQRKISNEEELLKSDIKLGTHLSVMHLFPDLESKPYRIDLFCVSFEECQRRLATSGNLAYLGPAVNLDYLSAKYYGKIDQSDIICHIDGYFVMQFVTLPVIRGFPLLKKFDEIISNLLKAGIVKEWWELFIWKIRFSSQGNTNKSPDDYVKFSLQHLQSVFICLFLGYTISLVVFIAEIVWFRFKS